VNRVIRRKRVSCVVLVPLDYFDFSFFLFSVSFS